LKKTTEDRRTLAQLKVIVARENKAADASYLKRRTAFMRDHMDEYDKQRNRRARTIRAR
jgi:hypothetical protein